MTAMKKAGFLNPHLFTMKTGEKEYLADIPDGNVQLRYQIYADEAVSVYLGAGKIAIPLGRSTHFNRTIRVADAKFLLVRADPATTLAISVGTKPIRVSETPDHTPVDISVPEPLSVDISKMVSQLVGEALQAQGEGTEIDIEEIIGDLPEGTDPEFGPGFTLMQEDDPGVLKELEKIKQAEARAAKPPEPPKASSEPAAGNADDSKGKPAS